jgi:hypothetical protein
LAAGAAQTPHAVAVHYCSQIHVEGQGDKAEAAAAKALVQTDVLDDAQRESQAAAAEYLSGDARSVVAVLLAVVEYSHGCDCLTTRPDMSGATRREGVVGAVIFAIVVSEQSDRDD